MALIRAVLLLLVAAGAAADDRRAEIHYMLHCQGCHLPQALGFEGKVPRMNDFVGFFLHSEEGRDYLVRVPGVSSSALADDEIAELMNWLLRSYSAAELPEPFVPYTAEEVGALRADPVADPATARVAILSRLAGNLPALARRWPAATGAR